ncbi:hypothetical protein EGW08_011317 [Elysia chlorotica]|uniref:Uncharacterized protein n=1 Tax=Elysia chlorotica TaxID=188477 RepID=A0A433THF3_ELYCH|nr:hypothetical protein EGW08_011317 [Elysia chlorotica]
MMSGAMDRQGYIGDITTKPLSELRELLARKEKLLANRSLLQKLPDKGKKAYEFVQKVKELIEKKSQDCGSNTEIRSSVATRVGQDSIRDVVESVAGVYTHALDTTKARENKPGTHPIDSSMAKATPDTTDSLSDHFQNISIGPKVENVGQRVESNSYKKIIQRDCDTLVEKKSVRKFMPNKTLKPRDPHHSKMEASHCIMEKHRNEESAVYPPQYKHDKTKLIPLSESIQLTLEQQKKREELAIERTTSRLLGQISSKMDLYDPPSTDMNYREADKREVLDLDSDDDFGDNDDYP